MGNEVSSDIINIAFLQDLQDAFQKDLGDLIELYLHDAKRKILNLSKALEENNLSHFRSAARELRLRSIDVGAIQFSHYCLGLEMAAQEMRLDSLPGLLQSIEKHFSLVRDELGRIKKGYQVTI